MHAREIKHRSAATRAPRIARRHAQAIEEAERASAYLIGPWSAWFGRLLNVLKVVQAIDQGRLIDEIDQTACEPPGPIGAMVPLAPDDRSLIRAAAPTRRDPKVGQALREIAKLPAATGIFGPRPAPGAVPYEPEHIPEAVRRRGGRDAIAI